MKDTIDEIVELKQQGDPDDADFYTRELVQSLVSRSGMNPEEYLADMRASRAHWASVDWYKLPKVEDLPKDQVAKLAGPIDGLSYQLMKDAGTLDTVWPELPDEGGNL